MKLPDTAALDDGRPWVGVLPGAAALALPLVCDSPHSGTRYPSDYGFAVAPELLRKGEDTHIERLWSRAPELGATLIHAQFPRTYIDPNRALSDLDPALLAEPWPEPLQPTQRTRDLGMGLVWQLTPTGEPIYRRRLGVAELQRRIDLCWRPYHQALQQACDAALQRFGHCWHLNLHSMPSNAYERLGLTGRGPLADFVLGDLNGRTCAPGFVDAVRGAMQARGYRVAVNDPYAGQELVRLHGQPAQARHSLQIEVNRALYMHEPSREPNANFERLQADIGGILADVAAWIRQRGAG